MKTRKKSFYMAVLFIFMISFILPGCYTQLSRPQVDTQDEYYSDEYIEEYDTEEIEDYYDEGEEYVDPAVIYDTDVYVNPYPYWDSWSYSYYDPYYYDVYSWSYMGAYPNYWWSPYSHWWGPSWYVGYGYYDYYSWRNRGYYHDYYRYGYYEKPTRGRMQQRDFTRRTPGLADRQRRDEQRNVTRANPSAGVDRTVRPGNTLQNPTIRNDARAVKRADKNAPKVLTRPSLKDNKKIANELKKRYLNRSSVRKTTDRNKIRIRTIPRNTRQSVQKPRINTNPRSRVTRPSSTNKRYSPPSRSNRRSSSGYRPRSSSSSSRSSGKSYTPRSSSSSRSSATRSISKPPSRSSSRSSSSSSKGSSSSKKK